MIIKYVEGNRSVVDKYLKFRMDFITDFCNILLPLKINNAKGIRSKLYNYYMLSKFDNYDFQNEIRETNNSLFDIFRDNKIITEELQNICFSIIDINTLFEWKSIASDPKEIKYRKSLIDMVTTIYIALQYEKKLMLGKKVSFEEINSNIIRELKVATDVELLIRLNHKSDFVKILFESAIQKNTQLLLELDAYDTFKGKIYNIYNPSNDQLCIGTIAYSFKELKDDNKKEVAKISNKETVKTNLNKIMIDFNALYLIMMRLNCANMKLIIELNQGFFSNKNNIQYLSNRTKMLTNNIYIGIPYDSFEKYAETIELLNVNNYKTIIIVNEKNVEDCVDLSKFKGYEYILLRYSDNENFGNLLTNIKGSKMKPIVLDIPNKNLISKYNLEYYLLSTGVSK